ncbi:MFS transporter [Nonomuraea sp. NPDC046570]|uniref:MFS transporter n=1 Tax=Nonomuraea sp. NPDC046570 TaxID=3155255 RepID=UPI0033C29B2A
MRARLPLRLARSAAFTAVCVTLAALGHALAAGAGPAPWAITLGGVGVLVVATALTGTERSPTTVNLALLGTQAGLHELFGTDGTAVVLGLGHAHGQGLSEGLGMLLAHLTATLITGWWLARGETALWSLLRRLGLRPALWSPPPVPVVRQAKVAVVRSVPGRSSLRIEHVVSRRGPPLPA